MRRVRWNSVRVRLTLWNAFLMALLLTVSGIALCYRVQADLLRGKSIGAAPLVELGLKRLLIESGIDPAKDVKIGPVPGAFLGGAVVGVAESVALKASIFSSIPSPDTFMVFVILLIVLIARPQGLLGKAS